MYFKKEGQSQERQNVRKLVGPTIRNNLLSISPLFLIRYELGRLIGRIFLQ